MRLLLLFASICDFQRDDHHFNLYDDAESSVLVARVFVVVIVMSWCRDDDVVMMSSSMLLMFDGLHPIPVVGAEQS